MQILTKSQQQATVGGFLGATYLSALPAVPTRDPISNWLQRLVQHWLAQPQRS
ncbi:MAG: hypothetical protein ISP86_03145 [Shewanellaceae bacterium]|nr:hypothetical protein [Shewanellaceae bacterium]